MSSICFYAGILLAFYLFFYIEAKRHEQNLAKLSLRIHVNGTRGKSSVTRLIAAGLRAGGHKVFAKTTGTEAKLIFPDGSEQYLDRRGPANIHENIAVVRQAVSYGATAIVMECMAIHPQLQKFCEQRLIRAHIGVITNVRADHEDVMGNGIESVAAALSNTVPVQGILVTTPNAHKLLEPLLGGNQQSITAGGDGLNEESLQGFAYEVVPDNIAIALKVCELAGVDRKSALAGMCKATPDAGNLTIRELVVGPKTVTVINALAANDPESTLWLWNTYMQSREPVVVLLNCRADRKFRTAQLCEVLAKVHKGNFIVAGDKSFATSLLIRHGVCPENIDSIGEASDFSDLKELIDQWTENRVSIFAAGNMKGLSRQLMLELNGGS